MPPPFSTRHPIAPSSITIFTNIHDKLFEAIKDQLTIGKEKEPVSPLVWTYSYPKDATNYVNAPAVVSWEEQHAILLEGFPAYQKDFVRDYSILNMLGRTSQGIDDLLTYLLRNSNYSEEEQDSILTWLKSNGGQDSNRFIDALLASGAFTNHIPAAQFKSKGIEQNWTISPEGKVILQLDILLKGLVVDGEVCQVNPQTQELETVELENDNSHNRVPTLRVGATLQLDITGGKVQPHLTELEVTSYTKSLFRPSPVASAAQQRAEPLGPAVKR